MPTDAVAWTREFFATMDRHDWPAVRALLHPEHRFHFPGGPAPLGPDEHIGFTSAFVAAFPDFRHTIHEQFAAGDRVVTRGIIHLTHRGPFQGIPPTGAHADVSFINILRVADGRNREEWVEMDMVSLLAAIGALHPPG
jgi:predicted ester cyclase